MKQSLAMVMACARKEQVVSRKAKTRELDVSRSGLDTMRSLTLETNERISALVAAFGDYIRSREAYLS